MLTDVNLGSRTAIPLGMTCRDKPGAKHRAPDGDHFRGDWQSYAAAKWRCRVTSHCRRRRRRGSSADAPTPDASRRHNQAAPKYGWLLLDWHRWASRSPMSEKPDMGHPIISGWSYLRHPPDRPPQLLGSTCTQLPSGVRFVPYSRSSKSRTSEDEKSGPFVCTRGPNKRKRSFGSTRVRNRFSDTLTLR
jgi:hypothetical protein